MKHDIAETINTLDIQIRMLSAPVGDSRATYYYTQRGLKMTLSGLWSNGYFKSSRISFDQRKLWDCLTEERQSKLKRRIEEYISENFKCSYSGVVWQDD